MSKDLITTLASQGFAVIVAAFLLVKVAAMLRELTRQVALNTRAIALLSLNDPQASAGRKKEAEALVKETEVRDGS